MDMLENSSLFLNTSQGPKLMSRGGSEGETAGFILTMLSYILIGTVGNVLVLIVYSTTANVQTRHVTVLLVRGLAVQDLLLCAVAAPWTLYIGLKNYTFLSQPECTLYWSFITAQIPMTSTTFALLSVERYNCICNSSSKDILSRRSVKIVLGCIITISLTLGTLSGLTHRRQNNKALEHFSNINFKSPIFGTRNQYSFNNTDYYDNESISETKSPNFLLHAKALEMFSSLSLRCVSSDTEPFGFHGNKAIQFINLSVFVATFFLVAICYSRIHLFLKRNENSLRDFVSNSTPTNTAQNGSLTQTSKPTFRLSQLRGQEATKQNEHIGSLDSNSNSQLRTHNPEDVNSEGSINKTQGNSHKKQDTPETTTSPSTNPKTFIISITSPTKTKRLSLTISPRRTPRLSISAPPSAPNPTLAQARPSLANPTFQVRQILRNRRLMHMFVAMVALYGLAFLFPLLITAKQIPYNLMLYHMFYLNNALNPLVYVLFSQQFRTGLKTLFCKGKRRERNH